MAVASRGKQWKERETSPERTKVWTEPKPVEKRRVPVVYYLSRNGHLEHPHFMEVSLSSTDGLYLRDVINRLNSLRGKGMASMYSWSSKRSYKNGFVWHDLCDDDFIYPAHGHEYVLKGSEILQLNNSSPQSQDTASSSGSSDKAFDAIPKPLADDFPPRRKKTPWSSLDLAEYKVYKTDPTAAEATLKAADASTQTDDKKQRRRDRKESESESRGEVPVAENPTTELERDEISPPPSSSSPETLESLIKADGRLIAVDRDRTAGSNYPSGRMRASAVLMHLISCGSMGSMSSVKDHGLSLASQCRGRMPRGGLDQEEGKETDGLIGNPCFSALRLEDKEYFSGSLIETKKKGCGDGAAELPGLKRSSSYNADRSSKLELVEKEGEGVRNKCIPRKHKAAAAARREGNAAISRSAHGSKRITDEPPQK